MDIKYYIAFALFLARCMGQRPSFAGRGPIGYPALETTPTTGGLGNRFGDESDTTAKLPLQALGDRDLVNRLSRLPVDKQPFWFINWRIYEEYLRRPQTYTLRPNPFADPLNQFQ